MRRDEIEEGKFVWFATDDGGSRTGFIVNVTTKGSIKADILWEKSGDSYTVKRTPIDKIQTYITYPTEKEEYAAVRNFCKRVLGKNANSTGSAEKIAKELIKEYK